MLVNKYKYNCATVLLKNKQGSEYCFRVINKYNNPVNKTCNSRMMGLLSLSNVISSLRENVPRINSYSCHPLKSCLIITNYSPTFFNNTICGRVFLFFFGGRCAYKSVYESDIAFPQERAHVSR